MLAFANNFWGADLTSSAGFDTLCKKMKDGSQICNYFEDFIRQRADAEEKYGKALVKLGRTPLSGEEYGTMLMSWEKMRQETESIGQSHIELSQKLLNELERSVREFREMHKSKRKPIEETIKRDQTLKKKCFENVGKLKRAYEQRCREKDGAEEALTRSSSQAVSIKDEERLRKNISRAKTAFEQADYAYQNSVRQLEEARVQWERDFDDCCKVFQKLEEERISHLRNMMWVYTNFGSISCVKEDTYYEEMRKILEHCDINKDIHLFISMKQTGNEKPAPVLYEDYYVSNRPVVPPAKFPQSVQPTSPISIGSPLHLPETIMQPAQESRQRLVRAEFDYDAQGDQELSFKAGTVIKVLYEESKVWLCGEIDGRKGMIPQDYVGPI